MQTGTIATIVTDIKAGSDTVLGLIEGLDPGLAAPAETAEAVVDVLSTLASKALAALAEAQGTPITPESVLALMPNAIPLTPPDDAGTTQTQPESTAGTAGQRS